MQKQAMVDKELVLYFMELPRIFTGLGDRTTLTIQGTDIHNLLQTQR